MMTGLWFCSSKAPISLVKICLNVLKIVWKWFPQQTSENHGCFAFSDLQNISKK